MAKAIKKKSTYHQKNVSKAFIDIPPLSVVGSHLLHSSIKDAKSGLNHVCKIFLVGSTIVRWSHLLQDMTISKKLLVSQNNTLKRGSHEKYILSQSLPAHCDGFYAASIILTKQKLFKIEVLSVKHLYNRD